MSFAARFCALALAVVTVCASPAGAASSPADSTFAQFGAQATNTLLGVYYTGSGAWRNCDRATCTAANSDWGVDSATDALYLRWNQTHDPRIRDVMQALLARAPRYAKRCTSLPCGAWSDTPEWDAVAFMREYQVTQDQRALQDARRAFDYVARSPVFHLGACPGVPFQRPQPSISRVKTLETLANAVKAALLLYRVTHESRYLNFAISGYQKARTYFFDSSAALYTVHVIDDGVSCAQVPRRFFASVNGDMIWNGIALWNVTGTAVYRDEALETSHAVDSALSDARGVFADIQGENDVVEPLVEAMDVLATAHEPFAADWIRRNALAAASSRAADGAFARFFDGPPQQQNTIWQSNGGIALAIAASALDPTAPVPLQDDWSDGRPVGAPIVALPATISIDGSGVALIGTIGRACLRDHIRVFVDGAETFDHTGLWQNRSMPESDPVFFAWRWPVAGHHTITLERSDTRPAAAGSLDLQAVAVQ